jgi:hypothetical protein
MAALRHIVVATLVATSVLASCHHERRPTLAHQVPAAGDDVTLYQDAALIRQRVEVELPATPKQIKVELAAGVPADQIIVLDHGGVTVRSLVAKTSAPSEGDEDDIVAPPAPNPPPEPEADIEGMGPERDAPPSKIPGAEDSAEEHAPFRRGRPTIVTLEVQAPRAGTYALVLGYTTDRLHWDVAYTMIADVTRDRGELRGALAIRNETGIALHVASSRLIDAKLPQWRAKMAERLATSLVGGTQGSMLPAPARELGAMELVTGETRVELVANTARRMRSVLVYDPIGTKLDNAQPSPLRDRALGTLPKPTDRVTESFEVARDVAGSAGLPAGPVRLLERHADGSLAVLGESRLFEASTRVSDVDTIAVGTAENVTASRERREITIDDDGKRLTEEFVITIDNKRAIPVEVLLREHLYRGQNWALAFHSAPEATKDGPQQISLRTRVPAKSTTKILYVVVYTWTP